MKNLYTLAGIFLLVLLSLVLVSSLASAQIMLNEVMATPAVQDTGEYIELYNSGTNSVDVAGWTVDSDTIIDYTGSSDFGLSGTLIPAGGYGLIMDSEYAGDYALFLANNANASNLIMLTTDDTTLGNGGLTSSDNIVLGNGTEVERFSWINAQTKRSFEKINASLGNESSNWKVSREGGSPGTSNALNQLPVFNSSPPLAVNEDSTYRYEIFASDADNDTLSIAIQNIPSWLQFTDVGNGSALLSGTASNADVGVYQITLNVSDGIDSTEQQFNVTVVNINDAPLAENVSGNTNEDAPINLTLIYTDVDSNDQAQSCSVQNIVAAISTCSCNNGTCFALITPSANSTQTITATYTVSDGEASSNTATLTINVTATNDPPSLQAIAPSQATEALQFNVPLAVTDIDSNASALFIDASSSTLPAWLQPAGAGQGVGLMLQGTPSNTDVGTNTYTVVVSDGTSSANTSFNLTVISALQIKHTRIIKNGLNLTSLYGISPGDRMRVEIAFVNNLNQSLSHIHSEAQSNISGFAELPYLGSCTAESCSQGEWVLAAGATGSDNFTFTVPYTIASDFNLTITVISDGRNAFNREFSSASRIPFILQREIAALEFLSANLSDSNLTCTRHSNLTLAIVNSGASTIAPELLIYDQQPLLSSFDTGSGQFTQFTATPSISLHQSLPDIATGEQLNISQLVNLSVHRSGEHALYLFLTNPQFDTSQFYVGDSAQLSFKAGSCLNVTALQQTFTISKSSATVTNASLLSYLQEDRAYPFTFTLVNQSNPGLIACAVGSAGSSSAELHCDAPAAGQSGRSIMTIAIASAPSQIEEQFTVTVSSALEIEGLSINQIAVPENASTPLLRPAQSATVDLSVRNTLGYPLTGVQVTIDLAGTILAIDSFNLAAAQSRQLHVNIAIPYNLSAGDYASLITVSASDYNNNSIVQSDSYPFRLTIAQNPADLIISNIMGKTIYCNSSSSVDVEVTNRGSNDEVDVILQLKGSSLSLNSSLLQVHRNSKATYRFEIPSLNLSLGSNTLTATLLYRNAFNQDVGTLNLERKPCLHDVSPAKDALLIADNFPTHFSVNLSELGFNSSVNWYLDERLVAQGVGYDVSASEGIHTLKAVILAAEQEEHSWQITITKVPISRSFTMNVAATATDSQLASYNNFIIQNQYGEIHFTQPIDLRNIASIDDLATLAINSQQEATAAVDTQTAPQLQTSAIIIFKKSFQNPVLLKSAAFNDGSFQVCPAASCTILTNSNGQFVFNVDGFSTYRVQEQGQETIQVSDINFGQVDRNSTVNTTVTITNPSQFESLSNLQADISAIGSLYAAALLSTPSSTLSPASSTSFTLQVHVPGNENTAEHSIGGLKITAQRGSQNFSQTKPVIINPSSSLSIESVEVNGDRDGDLRLDKKNKVEITMRNHYAQDMRLKLRATLENVAGDDLEETETLTLRTGDTDSVTFEYDLNPKDIDEDSYELDVQVEGRADDGSRHTATSTIGLDVKREQHKVIIDTIRLLPPIAQCRAQADVEVINIGQKKEKELMVRMASVPLGIELEQQIELDEATRSDDRKSIRFNLELQNYSAGSYPLSIEVLRDGKVEDSKQQAIIVEDCYTKRQAEQVTDAFAVNLGQEVQTALLRRQQTVLQPQIESFRDTDLYLTLLLLLLGLGVVAMVLALALLMKRKGKPRK